MWQFYLIDVFKNLQYEVEEPLGFDSTEFTLKRSDAYYGMEFIFADTMTFDGNGAQILREAYNRHGVNAEVKIIVTNRPCNFSYHGFVVFSSYKETDYCPEDDCGGEVSVIISQSGFTERFKNLIDLPVSLEINPPPGTTTISSRPLHLHSKAIRYESTYKINPALKDYIITDPTGAHVPPLQIQSSDLEGASEPFSYTPVSEQPLVYSGFEFLPGVQKRVININGHFVFSCDIGNTTGTLAIVLIIKGVEESAARLQEALYTQPLLSGQHSIDSGEFSYQAELLEHENLIL